MGTEGQTLVLNANNALVQYVLNNPEGEHVNMFCQQIYDLALLSHCPLSADVYKRQELYYFSVEASWLQRYNRYAGKFPGTL